MPAGLVLLAALVFGLGFRADAAASRAAPSYSGSSIVNAADNLPGPLAPNGIATIYGTNLAYTTKAISSTDIHSGILPIVLPGTGIHVFVSGIAAAIYFVSPNQINFLVPNMLIAGPSDVQVVLDGLAGPLQPIRIAATSPAFFQLDSQTVIATHADGSLLTADQPASAGEYIVLYATGLGQVVPPLGNLQVPSSALKIAQFSNLQITLDGVLLDPRLIAYAGVSPGFGGLYQINLRLPDSVGPNPEIRVNITDQVSPPGLKLHTHP